VLASKKSLANVLVKLLELTICLNCTFTYTRSVIKTCIEYYSKLNGQTLVLTLIRTDKHT